MKAFAMYKRWVIDAKNVSSNQGSGLYGKAQKCQSAAIRGLEQGLVWHISVFGKHFLALIKIVYCFAYIFNLGKVKYKGRRTKQSE